MFILFRSNILQDVLIIPESSSISFSNNASIHTASINYVAEILSISAPIVNISSSLIVPNFAIIGSITSSLYGTASYAITASYALNGGSGGGTVDTSSFVQISQTSSMSVLSASYASNSNSSEIGLPESGSSYNGLFSDFVTSTKVGIPIDRFNQVLKELAPPPAPNLTQIISSNTGANCNLSFGVSNNIANYINVLGTGSLTTVDRGESFALSTISSDYRKGIFSGTTIVGELNSSVIANGSPYINYEAKSFGNANSGIMYLDVNGIEIHSVDLSVFTFGSSLNSNGSGFILSATDSAHFPTTGATLDLFKHRSGSYTISINDQRQGWNYAKIIYNNITTNYIDWINDYSGSLSLNAITFTNPINVSSSLVMSGIKYLSGVKYHTGGSGNFIITASNAYINEYSQGNAISYTVSNLTSISSEAIPLCITNQNQKIELNKSVTIITSGIRLLNQSVSMYTLITHPLRSIATSTTDTATGILLDNVTENATDLIEYFNGENYRVVSSSYSLQADVPTTSTGANSFSSGGNVGDIDLSVENGLHTYNGSLYSPLNTFNGGNFTTPSRGYISNKNYSTFPASTILTYYRRFKNTTGSTKFNIRVTIAGTGTLIAHTTSLSAASNQFVCEYKLPLNSSVFLTGWMDMYIPYSTGQTGDGAGGLSGTLDSSVPFTNVVTTGNQGIDNNNYIVMKFTALADWTGRFDDITVAFQ